MSSAVVPTPPPPPPPPGLFVQIVFLATFGVAIVVDAAFILALYRGRRLFNTICFFRLVYILTLLDAVSIVMQAIALLPQLCNASNSTLMYGGIVMTVIDGTNIGVMCYSMLVALNRFFVFCWHPGRRMFNRPGCYLTMSTTWAVVVVLVVAKNVYCPRVFSSKYMMYVNMDEDDLDVKSSPSIAMVIGMIAYKIVQILVLCTPVLMMILYIFVYRAIRNTRKIATPIPKARSGCNSDTALLKQAFLLCFIIELYEVLNFIQPYVSPAPTNDMQQNVMAAMRTTIAPNHNGIHTSTMTTTPDPTLPQPPSPIFPTLMTLAQLVLHFINPLIFFISNQSIRGALMGRITRFTSISGPAGSSQTAPQLGRPSPALSAPITINTAFETTSASQPRKSMPMTPPDSTTNDNPSQVDKKPI